MKHQRAELAQVRALVLLACPPVFVMEVAEVSLALTHLVEIAKGDIQSDFTLP
jgi:hypothetical protein